MSESSTDRRETFSEPSPAGNTGACTSTAREPIADQANFDDWAGTFHRNSGRCNGQCRQRTCEMECASELLCTARDALDALAYSHDSATGHVNYAARTILLMCHNGDYPEVLHSRLAERGVTLPKSREAMFGVSVAVLDALASVVIRDPETAESFREALDMTGYIDDDGTLNARSATYSPDWNPASSEATEQAAGT